MIRARRQQWKQVYSILHASPNAQKPYYVLRESDSTEKGLKGLVWDVGLRDLFRLTDVRAANTHEQ
jgi:hypothetical protein